MLEAKSVSFSVRTAELLTDVSVKAEPGRLHAIIGPNGAGKSTLLRIMAGEMKPTSGSIELDGRNIADIKPADLSARRAVVPQATHLGFPFTAAEVVALGHSVPGFAGENQRMANIVKTAMDKVEMWPLAERSYQSLSGGERQRVHFARALCQVFSSRSEESKVLMLDEATSNLDLAHQLLVLSEARQIARNGAAVIAVLHDWNLAAYFADDMLLLSEGRVAAAGKPSDVLTDNLLSDVFRCDVKCNVPPATDIPFVLPQSCARL